MVCSPDMSHVFEKRLAEICGSIADVETRCSASEARAQSAELRAEESEAQVLEYADRCVTWSPRHTPDECYCVCAIRSAPWHAWIRELHCGPC